MKNPRVLIASLIFAMSAIDAMASDPPYRHSFQFNLAGLGFERWGLAYELRMTPRHALFFQGGGSFPFVSEEQEYGFGLHNKLKSTVPADGASWAEMYRISSGLDFGLCLGFSFGAGKK